MLIVGARGFATQLFDVIQQIEINGDYIFYDDHNLDAPPFLFKKYKVLKDINSVIDVFKNGQTNFCLGIGNGNLRNSFLTKFEAIGGMCQSIISPFARIGYNNVQIGKGSTILTNVVIESNVKIGTGALLNLGVHITHDNQIGDFCEFSPGVNISGDCRIGNFCSFGVGSVVLPKIKIGNNVTIGAGAVVTKNIPDFATVKGVPAR